MSIKVVKNGTSRPGEVMVLASPSHPYLREVLADLRGDVQYEVPLAPFTSLKIGGPAEALVTPCDLEDLRELMKKLRQYSITWTVLGGTNVLVQDRGIRGVVVSLSNLSHIREESEDLLFAEAGVRMPVLLQHAVNRSLSGLEWAAGIPGTVGGGVAMNAGTHLGEMKDVIHAVQMITLEGDLVTVPKTAVKFTYRYAALPSGIVSGAWFALAKASRKKIETVTKQYLQYRKNTQPLTRPNAGSVFKNPPGNSAGKLIEEAGLKGERIGDAQISLKHGNFIVNLGRARATDVVLLVKKAQQTVFHHAGIMLELELKIIGDP